MGLTVKRRVKMGPYHIVIGGVISFLFIAHNTPLFGTDASAPSIPRVSTSSQHAFSHSSSHPASASSARPPAASSSAAAATLSICQASPTMNATLTKAVSPQLRKLAEYEQACPEVSVDRASFFTGTPTTIAEAHQQAADVASQLQEFASHGVAPLVFMEPTSASGLLDVSRYKDGAYDAALDAYFASLRSDGVSDSMMGIWVPLPEGNIPVWTSVAPTDFAAAVTKTLQFQKKYFPTSKGSVLLDSMTYPSAQSWQNGTYVSLLPYVQGIPAGLLDTIGLQGFPWSPPANDNEPPLSDPGVYLRTDLAAQAARAVGVSSIWLNTGTFGAKYTNDPSLRATVAQNARQTQLAKTAQLASALKNQGFDTAVHLFAEDKSAVSEATDWSYWHDANLAASPETLLYQTFASTLQADGVSLWLFG